MRITLPDGTVKSYDEPVSGAQVAADIGPGLAKAAVGVKVDGELLDLARPIDHDGHLAIITRPRTNRKGGTTGGSNAAMPRTSAFRCTTTRFPQVRDRLCITNSRCPKT